MTSERKLKRFLAFVYDRYYPGGAAADYRGDFPTYEEAEAAKGNAENIDILDTETGEWA